MASSAFRPGDVVSEAAQAERGRGLSAQMPSTTQGPGRTPQMNVRTWAVQVVEHPEPAAAHRCLRAGGAPLSQGSCEAPPQKDTSSGDAWRPVAVDWALWGR